MKTIFYADIYILSNTAINFILLLFATRGCKIKATEIKLFTLSIIGAVLSMAMFVINSDTICYILKLSLMTLMCYFTAEHPNFKATIKLVSVFLIYALALSGILTMLNTSLPHITNNKVKFISYQSLCIALSILYLMSKSILRLLARQNIKNGNYKTVVIKHGNKSVTLIGFCDSGNTLFSPYDKLPIFVANINALKALLKYQTNNFDCITCNTILGKGYIPYFKPDLVTIDGMPTDAYIGVSESDFQNDYDIILNQHQKSSEMGQVYV